MKKKLALVLALVLVFGTVFAGGASAAAATKRTVDAYSGNYIGAIAENGIVSFRNIKYATTERWQEAVIAAKSDETFDCTGNSTDIPYQNRGSGNMTEDYLTLDIYMNNSSRAATRPVFVQVNYGGGTSSNSNGADFSEFLTQYPDIIIVNVNMRVAYFGCINLSVFDDYDKYADKYETSNNLSRTDFVAALKWVNQNIRAFGGDPDNVTLSGASGGGVMSCTPMIIEGASQYLNKVAMVSGVALDAISVGTLDESTVQTKHFMEFLGVTTIEEALKLTPAQINSATGNLQSLCIGAYLPGSQSKTFANVIDGVVIKEDYLETMKQACTKEGIKIMAITSDGEYDRDLSKATLKLDADATDEEWAAAALKAIVSANWGKLDPALGGVKNAQELIQGYVDRGETIDRDQVLSYQDLKNDINQKCSAVMICELWDALGGTAYLASYDYSATPGVRAAHAVALRPALGKKASSDEAMTEAVRASLVSFLRYGDPNRSNKFFDAAGVTWKPFTTAAHEEMVWDTDYACKPIGDVRWADINSLLPMFSEYASIQTMRGETPTVYEKGETTDPVEPDDPDEPPYTGDASTADFALLVCVLLASGAGIAVLSLKKRED